MVKFVDEELKSIRSEILDMWTLVYDQMKNACEAVTTADKEKAWDVLMREKKVNAYELKLDCDIEDFLTLYNPVAIDMRFTVAMLKINTDLERIGDFAENLARFALKLDGCPVDATLLAQTRLKEMADAVLEMLDTARQALTTEDRAKADSLFEKDNKGSYKRFRSRLITKDLIDEFGGNDITNQNSLESLDPKVHEADARRNNWLLDAHNLISSIGWGDNAETEEMFKDTAVKNALTSDVKYDIGDGKFGYYYLWEAKAHRDPNNYHKNRKKNSVRTESERERDFFDEYIDRRFSKIKDPAVKRYRAEQKAAVYEGWKRFGRRFTDILDGMESLDNIRPEKFKKMGEALADFETVHTKALHSKVGRRAYGQEVYSNETELLNRARDKYERDEHYKDDNKYPFRGFLVHNTPIVLNHITDADTGDFNLESFHKQADDIFFKSAQPFDPKNRYHVDAVQKIHLADFPEPGKAVRSKRDPNLVLLTRKGANGQIRNMIYWDNNPKMPYMMDFPRNDPQDPKIRDEDDYVKQTLYQKPVNITRNEYKESLAQQRAANELEIKKKSKEEKLAIREAKQAERKAVGQKVRSANDDFNQGVQEGLRARTVIVQEQADMNYDRDQKAKNGNPLRRTLQREGNGSETVGILKTAIPMLAVGAGVVLMKKHVLPKITLSRRAEEAPVFKTSGGFDIVSGDLSPAEGIKPKSPLQSAIDAVATRINQISQEPPIENNHPIRQTGPFTGTSTSSVVEYVPFDPIPDYSLD